MAFATDIKQMTVIESGDQSGIEKVRWSLRQRLRKQLAQLSTDLFDEVDDFLFSSGQKGQFAEDSIYLKAMRELRARQSQFEETFLGGVCNEIKASHKGRRSEQPAAVVENSISSGPAYERVEIDLALKAMQRKAEKVYLPVMKQIQAVQEEHGSSSPQQVIGSDVLIRATVAGFQQAHTVFSLPLEIRLVFIKLFEQHFLLRMDKLFEDIISIIQHVNEPSFIDKIYTASTAFRTNLSAPSKLEQQVQKTRTQMAAKGSQKAEAVEEAVSHLIATVCAGKRMPLFLEKMVRTKWRAVMFLVGLNRGCDGPEWAQALRTIKQLIAAVCDDNPLSPAQREQIFQQLRQGFSLAQIGEQEQEQFLAQLKQQLGTDSMLQRDNVTQLITPGADSGKTVIESSEAYINPTGEDILCADDMDEIAKLLGEGEGAGEKSLGERDLTAFVAEIEQLGEEVLVEFRINGSFEQCTLSVNPGNTDLYNLRDRNSGFSVCRTKLGLAVALQNGELRIPQYNPRGATLLNTLLNTAIVRH